MIYEKIFNVVFFECPLYVHHVNGIVFNQKDGDELLFHSFNALLVSILQSIVYQGIFSPRLILKRLEKVSEGGDVGNADPADETDNRGFNHLKNRHTQISYNGNVGYFE